MARVRPVAMVSLVGWSVVRVVARRRPGWRSAWWYLTGSLSALWCLERTAVLLGH